MLRTATGGRPTSDVDAYVAELDRALVGPRRGKRDLVREVRDHLQDATEAYRGAGLDAGSAQRRAVTDFGAVATIAPQLQVELGLTQGRRTALLTFAVLVVQPLLWQGFWPWFSGDPDQSSAGVYATVDLVLESAGGVAIVLCALATVACGIGSRYRAARRVAPRCTAVLALSCVVMFPVLGTVLSTQAPATSSVALDLAWVGLLLVLPLGFVATSARRCLRAC